HATEFADQREDRRQGPGGAVHGGHQPPGEDAGQVGGQAATGDMAEAMQHRGPAGVEVVHEVQAVRGVDAGRDQQLLAQGAPEFGDLAVQGPSGVVDDPADQRVAVGMEARGGHGDDGVARADAFGAQQRVGFHGAGRGAGDVVLVLAQQARVLGGFAADQGGAGHRAALGDAAHDVGDALGDDLAAGDVVGHEQRFGPDHDDVVHDHPDQVLADGVVDVHGLGDGDLGPDAVGGGGQQGLLVGDQGTGIEQAGEPADPAEDGVVV